MSQTDFRAALLNPDLPVPKGLVDPQGRAAGRRFSVYRNNVTASLTEALRQAFPVVGALVGEEFFTAMAIEHLRAHPPLSPLMMFYGEDMPAFLAAFAPVQHLRYLPDIARLELALRYSYHAADATPLPPEAMQIAPDVLMGSTLRFSPALRLVRSDWPIHSIWMANTGSAAPPKAVVAEDVLILRRDFDPDPVLLPTGAAGFLAALLDGQTFGAALDATTPFDLTATLGIMISGGAIIGMSAGGDQ